jgi:hypothetical protein
MGFANLLKAAENTLELSKVKPEESVVLLTDSGSESEWVEAFRAAAVARGCDPIVLQFNARLGVMEELPELILDALLQADFSVDLTTSAWAYTDSHAKVELTDRMRMAMVGGGLQSARTLLLWPPTQEIVARLHRAQEMVDSAKTFRVTSDLGTDLTMQRGNIEEYPILLQGFGAVQPGEFRDPFGGWVAMALPEADVDGVIQFVGMIDFVGGPRHMIVEKPVRMEVKKGKLVSIGRDSPDGVFLDEWFKSWEDPNSYRFAHFNIGLDHRQRLYRHPDTLGHALYGGLLFAFGGNYAPGIFGSGATIRARSHTDMTLVGGDLYLDDQLILEGGEFTQESGLRA